MTRFLALFSFTGLFFVISPALRESAMSCINDMASYTSLYSPYSYILLAIFLLVGITLTLRTGQTVR